MIILRIDGWHPATTNQLMKVHWRKAYELSKRDKRIIADYQRAHSIPLAEGKRRVEITIGLGYKQRGADPDAYYKSLSDALVKAGLLKDDNKEHVEWAQPVYEKSATKLPYTILRITDI